MKKSEVIDLLEDVVVLLKGDGGCDDLISAVRYAIAVIQVGTSDKSQECNAINRDKALNLVLDVCDDVMDECETVTGMCGEEVYTDVREVDAILKCNKRIRNGIRQLPSEPVGNYDTLEWMPCSERLPEITFEGQRRGWYLTTNANGGVGVTGYEFYHDFMKTGWQSDTRIVAWLPLPEPYREEQI